MLKKIVYIALLAMFSFSCISQSKKAPVGISVQLYSVRGDMKKDFEGTLRKIKGMGFEGVEFAGYFQYESKPEELKKLLDEIGLKAAAAHIPTAKFLPENIQATIDFHKKIDCKMLIIPMDGMFYKSDETNQKLCDIVNKASVELAKHNMACGYHNHAVEFKEIPNNADGKVWWDLFAERTDKSVILQQDVGWTWIAGKEPAVYVKKYPERTLTTHFKAKIRKGGKGEPFVNENDMEWKELIKACHEVGGTQWFSIEQEEYPNGMQPLEAVERSYKNLMKLLKEMGYR
jgi:sugar phosphate isomerase/epimerase